MKFKLIIGYIALFTLASNWVFGQDSWKIDSTRLVFYISNAGLDVEGSMTGITAQIKFSKNKLDRSFFVAEAKPETLHTGIKLRDKHLKKADYFDIEKYPTIKIESKKIIQSKNGFDAYCAITLKGQMKEIVIPFMFKQTNRKAEFKGTFSLNRLDFGLGEKSIVLSDTVKIDIWAGTSRGTN